MLLGIEDYIDPDNATAQFKADMLALVSGDFDAVEVSWWVATRQAVSSHPGMLGQQVYAIAILNVG